MNAPETVLAASGIRRVGVVGAGVMGSGIAQWIAARGSEVILRDVQADALERGLDVMRGLLAEAVQRGKLTGAEAAAAAGRIATTTRWEGFDTCDLVIEAVVEDVASKRRVFSEIAAVARREALLASNTSALPIEEIAGHVPHPERTLGLHFFNPVSRMALVELVVSAHTSAATSARALGFVRGLGKQPIVCRSSPGFLVTRVLFFYLNAAVRLWEQGAATDAIDGAMREFGWPMGPLRLIDEVGLDVTDFIFGEMQHYFPARFVRAGACGRLVAAGLLGRKNGASRGFFRYGQDAAAANDAETRALVHGKHAPPVPDLAAFLMRVLVEEAERCLAEGVVQSPAEVDLALRLGAGFPAARGGLLAWARGAPEPRS